MQKIFLTVVDMSIVSSLVIAAVLLVRALLKKAPRRFAYVLWAAALLRLLCPFAIESPVSVIPERAEKLAQSAALPESEHVSFGSAASAA
ncbi:MAG: peptidase M56, partial [Butyricicoccus sp.]|nr:peptidase M56 [Butyricicoccus sp.]